MILLQKVMEHFQNLVILSDFSIKLIGLSLVITAIFSLYCLFFKSELYEKYMPWLGVTLRVLMFIGFTMEFAHHTKISSLLSFDNGKQNAVVQLSNYLFFAYVLVVGVYYVLTIGMNKFRGFFHSFDIAMVSLPIIYTFTAAAIYIPKGRFELGSLLYLGLLLVMILMIYLLFKMYWKQNIKWYVIFFLVAIPEVVILLSLRLEFPYALPIFLLLLALYEASRHIVEHIKVKTTKGLWKRLKLCSSIVILAVIMFGLTFCGVIPIRSNANNIVWMLFNKSIKLTTVQEAEKIARSALGDNKSKFVLTSGTSMDFYNFFYIILGDYNIEVIEDTGKVSQIHNNTLSKSQEAVTLKFNEVKEKTIYLLKQCGYTYEAEKTDMDIQEKGNLYEVSIKNKFSNGKSNSLKDFNNLQVSWFKNGKLSDMNGVGGLINLKDYKGIKIDEAVIEKSINTWYEKLGEKTPAYALAGAYSFTAYSNKYNTLKLICDNGNRLELDINDGTVRSFQRERQNRGEFDNVLYEKYKEKAIELCQKIILNSEKNKYILTNKHNQYSFYSFINEGKDVTRGINIYLDNEGKLSDVTEVNYRNRTMYSEKEFKVSKNQALKGVDNKYKPFNIYTKRVRLTEELQPSGEIKLKWMVVVIPYMSREHHIYFVDVNTGEIDALQNYKEGLRNE